MNSILRGIAIALLTVILCIVGIVAWAFLWTIFWIIAFVLLGMFAVGLVVAAFRKMLPRKPSLPARYVPSYIGPERRNYKQRCSDIN